MVSRPLIDILLFWNLFNWTIIIYIMLRTPLSSTLLLSPFPFPESQCPHSANKQQGPVCHSNTPLPGTGLLSLSYASSDVGTQKVVSFSCLWLPTPQWITLVSAGSVTFYDPWNIYLTFKSHTQLLTNYCIFFLCYFWSCFLVRKSVQLFLTLTWAELLHYEAAAMGRGETVVELIILCFSFRIPQRSRVCGFVYKSRAVRTTDAKAAANQS